MELVISNHILLNVFLFTKFATDQYDGLNFGKPFPWIESKRLIDIFRQLNCAF